jgi:hypothetical protein
MRLVDITFGLKPQALALLHYLADNDIEFYLKDEEDAAGYKTRTFPSYNGRERGVCLEVSNFRSPSCNNTLYIVWGDVRTSDEIFVQHWVQAGSVYNYPASESYPESSYELRKTFPCGDFGAAGAWICGLVQKYVNGKLK